MQKTKTHKKLPKLKSKFSKVAKYKVNTEKNLSHFYILVMNTWKQKFKI